MQTASPRSETPRCNPSAEWVETLRVLPMERGMDTVTNRAANVERTADTPPTRQELLAELERVVERVKVASEPDASTDPVNDDWIPQPRKRRRRR